MKRDGRKPKDSALTPNLAKKGGLPQRELKKLIEQKKKEIAAREQRRKIDRQAGLDSAPAAPAAPKQSDEDRMLADMWWVYRTAKFVNPDTGKQMTGRQKLLQLVQSDDKQYLFMVKELLRIEAQRKGQGGDGGGEQKTVFVVLKGLYDEEVVKKDGGLIDHEQIARALDPAAEKLEVGDAEDDALGWLRPEDQK